MPTDLPLELKRFPAKRKPLRMQKLYDLLRGGEEVHIMKLYAVYAGEDTNNQRHAQQIIGARVTQLNRRLKEYKKKVVPGGLKGTYVLCDDA